MRRNFLISSFLNHRRRGNQHNEGISSGTSLWYDHELRILHRGYVHRAVALGNSRLREARRGERGHEKRSSKHLEYFSVCV